MIDTMQIANFKAFAESQKIPLRPLTLIYGANSSGKSSIIQSLVLAQHAMETGDLEAHRTQLGGEAVDLGGFRQYVHKRQATRRMEWSVELDTTSFTGRLAELLASVEKLAVGVTIGIALDDQDRPLPEAVPNVYSYDLSAKGKSLLRMSRRGDGRFRLDLLDHEHPVFRRVINSLVQSATTSDSIQPEDYEGLDEAVSELIPQFTAIMGRFLPERLLFQDEPIGANPSILFPIGKGTRNKDLANALWMFFPRMLDDLVKGVTANIQEELNRLQYLGPLRSYPPRHLAFAQHHDPNWRSGGGYAWDVVRRNAKVRALVNEWLSAPDRLQTPYELRIRNLLTIGDLDFDFSTAIQEIETRFTSNEPYAWDLFGEIYSTFEYMKENEEKYTDIQELNLIDRRSDTIVSHRDVGIGISQVLPVLVEAYANKNQIIAIEQPEIHLHPALQADLGDVFIQSALGDQRNRFIIETHSEHLLLRIMRRMRETANNKIVPGVQAVTPRDVMVLFVEPEGTQSIIREMPLNEYGDLVKAWPGGFFEEGLREIF